MYILKKWNLNTVCKDKLLLDGNGKQKFLKWLVNKSKTTNLEKLYMCCIRLFFLI